MRRLPELAQITEALRRENLRQLWKASQPLAEGDPFDRYFEARKSIW